MNSVTKSDRDVSRVKNRRDLSSIQFVVPCFLPNEGAQIGSTF